MYWEINDRLRFKMGPGIKSVGLCSCYRRLERGLTDVTQIAAQRGQLDRARGFFELALSGSPSDETLAMLVKLAQKGMDPATIGSTGLRNMLLHLEAAGKTMKGHFAELGVALNDVNGHARSGRDVFTDLQRVFSSTEPVYNAVTHTLITQTDKARLASEMFGTRSATSVLGTLSWG